MTASPTMAEKIDRAVKSDTTGILYPILEAAYALIPLEKHEIITIAQNANKDLGFELFDDLYYPRLVYYFALVARAVQINSLQSK